MEQVTGFYIIICYSTLFAICHMAVTIAYHIKIYHIPQNKGLIERVLALTSLLIGLARRLSRVRLSTVPGLAFDLQPSRPTSTHTVGCPVVLRPARSLVHSPRVCSSGRSYGPSLFILMMILLNYPG